MLQLKDTDWLNGYKSKTHIYAVYRKSTSDLKTHTNQTNKGQTQRKKYKGNPIRLIADLSAETLQARREWQDIFKD